LGTAVVIEAEHLCMTMRGVRKFGARTLTSDFKGLLKTDMALRAEALALIRG
jgi:GTP cyclohydrolase I